MKALTPEDEQALQSFAVAGKAAKKRGQHVSVRGTLVRHDLVDASENDEKYESSATKITNLSHTDQGSRNTSE
jgi:hypothetical protein